MDGTVGVVVSTRYTAYQIKLKLQSGREITLWKRKFASQWGGRKNCQNSLQEALCDADGDAIIPILAAGVSVALTRDASHEMGRASIFSVQSVSAPTHAEAEAKRLLAYTNAISAWVSLASRNILTKEELQLIPALVQTHLQKKATDIFQVEDSLQEKERKQPAADVVKQAISLIRAAVNRVNIRSTLKQDLMKEASMAVPASELDILSVAMDNYDRFRQNPFDAHMSGTKRPLFKTLDTFARAYGHSPSFRGIAAVAYKLRLMLTDGGHSCCSAGDLMDSPMLDWTASEVRTFIIEGVRSHILVLDGLGGEDVYLPSVYRKEVAVGAAVSMLSQGGMVDAWASRVTAGGYAESVETAMQTSGLDAVQQDAVRSALTGAKDILVVSGYPGTGKSRVSRAIRDLCKQLGLVVVVCAPTAKAASRLGDGAMTVHRALGAVPCVGSSSLFRFALDQDKPIDADLVIVDEVSMLDMNVTHALLMACNPARTRLILVGDANQLPSVEWGDFLKALMGSPSVPRVFLEKIYRQDETGNTIWPLAKSIADGGPLLRSDLRSETVSWIADDSLRGVSTALIALHAEHGDKLQIISPSRRHGLHTGVLNEVILKRPVRTWDSRFDVGDRIVVIKNQSSLHAKGDAIPFMNGDCGTVVGVAATTLASSDAKKVMIRLDDDRAGTVMATDLEHAYALTTHKAQGSEYDVVAVVMSAQQGRALNRQSFYTSVSRAVKRLYIFAARETLSTCVSNVSEPRKSHLEERIQSHSMVLSKP